MTTPEGDRPGVPALPRSRRLVGVDAARGLALLGMMAAHLLDRTDAAGNPSAVFALVDGRSSATFALLAGVGLALADGGNGGTRTPYRQMVARTSVRALVILVVGLLLADAQPPVAIILQYYALSFLLLAPLLRLPAGILALNGVAWLLLAPFVSHAIRSATGLVGPGAQVGLTRLLVQPLGSLGDLLLTGYYPVLTWFGYLLVGAAVGRLALHRGVVAVTLLGAGLLLSIGADIVSTVLKAMSEAAEALQGVDLATGRSASGPFFGTTPTSSWWWLALDNPHSGTPPDMLGTTGAALVVLALCLLLARTAAGWALLPLAAAGSMTLTLYTVHVVAVLAGQPPLPPHPGWFVHAVLAVVLASLWRSRFTRGPLEALTAATVDAVAGPRPPAPTGADATAGHGGRGRPDGTLPSA